MCDLLLSFVVQLRLYHRTYLLYLHKFSRRVESRIPYVYLVYRSKLLALMGNVFDQLLSEHLLITEVLFLFRVIFFTKCIYPRTSCVYNFLTVNFCILHHLVNRLHVHHILFHLYIRNYLLLHS